MDFVILSGLSGAGKTTAQHALEDMGYFTIDNLPPCLWSTLIENSKTIKLKKIAIIIDIRAQLFLSDFDNALINLKSLGIKPKILFLNAIDTVLIQRYNLTRRTHPIGQSSLTHDLASERGLLEPIRSKADLIIDSSRTSASELKEIIWNRLSEKPKFNLHLRSFGFKRGVPIDADIVLDVRSMPNPYYDPKLRSKAGTQADVQAYVFTPNSLEFYTKLREFVRELILAAQDSGRANYNLAIGCTGGQHRSVAVVEKLAIDLADSFKPQIIHRDLQKSLAEHQKSA